jgi:import inner membrane translocase subunit TIM44
VVARLPCLDLAEFSSFRSKPPALDHFGISREISLAEGILMLPRHARRILLASSSSAATSNALVWKASLKRHGRSIVAHEFHSSSPRHNELPKSPFQTFVEVLKEEIHKNRELQDNMKQLSGDVDRLQDSEAMKKTREWYERARVRLSYN